MTKHNLFSNEPATNGLARGYGPPSHKRKREGLRFAVVVLLLAVASVVAVDKANANYIWECEDDIGWTLGAQKDATMVPPDNEIIVIQWVPPNKVVVLSGGDEGTNAVIENMNWLRDRLVIDGRYQDTFVGQGSTIFGDDGLIIPSILMFDVPVGSHFLSTETAIVIGSPNAKAMMGHSYCRRVQ